jgi:hypothetical protein
MIRGNAELIIIFDVLNAYELSGNADAATIPEFFCADASDVARITETSVPSSLILCLVRAVKVERPFALRLHH